jgi:S-formylglutathione hydrolase FrmB
MRSFDMPANLSAAKACASLRPILVRQRVNAIAAIFAVVLLGLTGNNPARAGVVAGTLFSPSHGRDFPYRVFLPPGYDANSATRYPVVFSLHGNGGTPAQRATNYSPTLTSKMNSGEIMPMIWVFPDGQRDSYYGDAYDGHKQVYTHIIDELLPVIDANYKTVADRDHRALEGFSMGGFGSGLYGAKRTDLFSATLLQGAVLPTWADLLRKEPDTALEMYNNVEANWLPYSIYDVTAVNATAIKETVNYKMVVGDADGHRAGNVAFRDYLVSLGIDPQFEWLPGVTHSGGLYLQNGTGLRFLNDHFLSVDPPPPPPEPTPGLLGEYFNDTALTSLASSRVDTTIDFKSDWGSAPAGTAVSPDDTFSVRWTGEVEVAAAGDWTFSTTSNDGVRLWIGDQLVINNWTMHAVTQNTATLSLAAGWQPLRLEYFQQKGVSEITLSYAGPGQAMTIIPTERLRIPVAGLAVTAVPEPGTCVLLVLGSLGLSGRCLHRQAPRSPGCNCRFGR